MCPFTERSACRQRLRSTERSRIADDKTTRSQTTEASQMYEWIKALHVIAVIAWMVGMLYLPRLFVYHCNAETGSKQSETFKVMERRLLKAIINPAMIVTWLSGLYLAWAGHWFSSPWLHGKLALVIILSGVHGFFSRCVKDFAADRNTI